MKYVLAPIAGFTSAPFRRLCSRRGADLTYTEMVSAAGLAHGSSPTRHLMEVLPGEGPVACQLFGANPEELSFAAAEADRTGRFVELNLNAGCPMPKIVHEGAGAALLRDPELVHRCLVAMKGATSLPVTLKTRPGPKPDRVLLFELIDAAVTAGAAGFTLHARFTSQMHGGPVNLELLAEAVARSPIPITGNGGVYNRATARAMAATGVDSIMIARAALANPWIFDDLRSQAADDEVEGAIRRFQLQNEAYREHLASILEFREQLAAAFPDDHVSSPDGFATIAMHTHLFRYFNGRPGAAELRRRLDAVRTIAEMERAVSPLLVAAPSAPNSPSCGQSSSSTCPPS